MSKFLISHSTSFAAWLTFSRLPVDKLSKTTTSWPSFIRRSAICEPTNPAPPVTITLLIGPPPGELFVELLDGFEKFEVNAGVFRETDERAGVFRQAFAAVAAVAAVPDVQVRTPDAPVRAHAVRDQVIINAEPLGEVIHLIGKNDFYRKPGVPEIFRKLRGCGRHDLGKRRERQKLHDLSGHVKTFVRVADDLPVWI